MLCYISHCVTIMNLYILKKNNSTVSSIRFVLHVHIITDSLACICSSISHGSTDGSTDGSIDQPLEAN